MQPLNGIYFPHNATFCFYGMKLFGYEQIDDSFQKAAD